MKRMKMTRCVTFSSGHRYWFSHLSEAENQAHFGPWASPYNHGHNYGLEVTVEGEVSADTGMIVNIKLIDDLLRAHILSQFDQRSINDQVSHFEATAPTLENLINYIWDQLTESHPLPSEVKLTGIHLSETPLLYAERRLNEPMTLTRVYEFAASHRLHVPSMSAAENIALFGKCNNAAGHGHNYVLEVSVSGSPDPRTGMLVDIGALDKAVHDLVVDRYDHKNFNEDIPEFEGRPTTSEYVAAEIFSRLKGKLPAELAKVRLHETARNIFEVTA